MLNRPAPARVVKFKGKKILHYAAAVAVLITAGALTYFQYTKKQSWSLTKYEYHTTAGSRQTIMLPDGSVVMLNTNSHLYIGKDLRTVTLNGEAFFDIRHDAVHPFLVHTKDYNIRVLGTSFNVRAYAGARRTETDLITGKVEIVPATKEKVVLRPNEKFILAPAATAPVKGTIAHLDVDTLTHHATETSWARNRMDVHDETLAAIAQKLEAWYGIRIIFASEKARQYRYTASFNDETVFRALQYLKQSYPFSYKVEGDLIIISES
ncbi:FecR family protein [Chitinophaga parva]|nr:FecR domain-containing protein [Chitinophaga parva]